MGSVVVGHRLSCSAALRDLPRPGIELVSPALQGRLLTKGPPGKPWTLLFGSGILQRGVLEVQDPVSLKMKEDWTFSGLNLG